MINLFRDENRFLSNFYTSEVEYDGVKYISVEHAYQAAKYLDKNFRVQFEKMTAGEAKKFAAANKSKVRPDWQSVSLQIMEDLVRQKFTTNPKLKKRLLDTIPHEIQEGNNWGDRFWGTVNGIGENHLGKILMKIRDELNDQK